MLLFLSFLCIVLFIVALFLAYMEWKNTAVSYEVIVGRSTWIALHAMADHFPVSPTDEEKAAAKGIINGFALLYPCIKCREHLQTYIDQHPITCNTRIQLVTWLFHLHNAVNQRLGKRTLNHISDRFVAYTAAQPRLDVTTLNVSSGECKACSSL